MLRQQRLVAASVDHELEAEPLEVFEAQPVAGTLGLDPFAAEPLGPEVERRLGTDAKDDRVDHPAAGASGDGGRVLEEGDVAAGTPSLVRVEEVVDGRIVLVDRLLHQAQAEEPRVEIDVPRRVARDAGDVVDPFEAHDPIVPDQPPVAEKCW